MSNLILVTREELYEWVWTTPTQQLAERFGISDVALAKICKKLKVPKPPRGYWAQVASGYKPRKAALPKVGSAHQQHVYLDGEPKIVEKPSLSGPTLSLIETVNQKEISIPDVLARPHPLIRATRAYLKSQKPNDYGMLWRNEDCVDIRISKTSMMRGLILLDVLFRQLESLGYQISLSDRSGTRISKGGIEMKVSLYERASRSENPPPEKDAPSWSYDRYSFTPSGELELNLERWPLNQRRWRDTPTTKLEDRLTDIVVEIVGSSDLLQQDRERRALEEAERQRIAREREEQRRIEEEEIRRRTDLFDQATSWVTVDNLRNFIAQSENVLKKSAAAENERLSSWVAWAQQQADSVDPILNGRFIRSVMERSDQKSLADYIPDIPSCLGMNLRRT